MYLPLYSVTISITGKGQRICYKRYDWRSLPRISEESLLRSHSVRQNHDVLHSVFANHCDWPFETLVPVTVNQPISLNEFFSFVFSIRFTISENICRLMFSVYFVKMLLEQENYEINNNVKTAKQHPSYNSSINQNMIQQLMLFTRIRVLFNLIIIKR